jgi:hypothetical protein
MSKYTLEELRTFNTKNAEIIQQANGGKAKILKWYVESIPQQTRLVTEYIDIDGKVLTHTNIL